MPRNRASDQRPTHGRAAAAGKSTTNRFSYGSIPLNEHRVVTTA
jgi:hypothetical protein